MDLLTKEHHKSDALKDELPGLQDDGNSAFKTDSLSNEPAAPFAATTPSLEGGSSDSGGLDADDLAKLKDLGIDPDHVSDNEDDTTSDSKDPQADTDLSKLEEETDKKLQDIDTASLKAGDSDDATAKDDSDPFAKLQAIANPTPDPMAVLDGIGKDQSSLLWS